MLLCTVTYIVPEGAMQAAVGERIISILACHCTLHAARLTCWQVVASGVTEG